MAGRMTLRHLEIFVAVCTSGGVGAAARSLSISQPSVSQAVRDLEEHFGVRLFDRISRRMDLTYEGERLLGYARGVLDGMEELERGMTDGAGALKLRIASSITTGTCYLPDAVRSFTQAFPQAEVSVRIEDSESVERAVLANEADIGLIEGLVHHGEIEAVPFAQDELAIVAGPGDATSVGCVEDLGRLPLILRERGSGVRELFDAALRERGVAVRPVWESVSTEAIKAAVGRGLGISVLPERLVCRELAEGELVRIKVPDLVLHRDLLLIRHRRKALSEAVRAFSNLMVHGGMERRSPEAF